MLCLRNQLNCCCLRKATAHKNENAANTNACAKLSNLKSAHIDRSGKLFPGKPQSVLSTIVHKMANTACFSSTNYGNFLLLANQVAVICR